MLSRLPRTTAGSACTAWRAPPRTLSPLHAPRARASARRHPGAACFGGAANVYDGCGTPDSGSASSGDVSLRPRAAGGGDCAGAGAGAVVKSIERAGHSGDASCTGESNGRSAVGVGAGVVCAEAVLRLGVDGDADAGDSSRTCARSSESAEGRPARVIAPADAGAGKGKGGSGVVGSVCRLPRALSPGGGCANAVSRGVGVPAAMSAPGLPRTEGASSDGESAPESSIVRARMALAERWCSVCTLDADAYERAGSSLMDGRQCRDFWLWVGEYEQYCMHACMHVCVYVKRREEGWRAG
jgi:hypothetical protein